jgi:hypothetical protein
MSVEEIAKVMQKTNIGVRVLLHRSRRRLADSLENRQDDATLSMVRPAAYSEGTSYDVPFYQWRLNAKSMTEGQNSAME